MASACVNNIGTSPEKFLDSPAGFSSYGWLSPRASFGRDMAKDEQAALEVTDAGKSVPPPPSGSPNKDLNTEDTFADFADFEFRLEDPVTMLPADELFANGKLVPLHLSAVRHESGSSAIFCSDRSPDTPKFRWRSEITGTDPYLFSPKAPRCSSRWKELLGLRKLYHNSNVKRDSQKVTSSQGSNGVKSIRHFLNRNSRTPNDSFLNLPLLKDTDNESVSVSSRLSLSSSSSGHDHDDLPRLSLDSEKPGKANVNAKSTSNPPRVRLVRPRVADAMGNRVGRSPVRRQADSTAAVRGASVDSPRMNSSGKIVFHGLERSSSSPSSFNGGPRFKHRGMERSYSANVRVSPVLNVPVCSLRSTSKSGGGVFGFPMFFSPQKRECGGSSSGGGTKNQQRGCGKNRTDRN